MKDFKPEDFEFTPRNVGGPNSNDSSTGQDENENKRDLNTFFSACLCPTQVNCAGTGACTATPNTDCCDMTRADACVEPLSPKCTFTFDIHCQLLTTDCETSVGECLLSSGVNCDFSVDKCLISSEEDCQLTLDQCPISSGIDCGLSFDNCIITDK
ncbi:MAG: hypothetical protein NC388_00010 [Clostridium sp.]|nr:hypothetical protein [Clostridium sp.]